LLLALMASAIAVVQLKHETRQRFVELQALQAQRDALNVEWGQLLLEEGAWSQHRRVEVLARTRIGMSVPDPRNVAVVRLSGDQTP
ncbi:MAG: cell division protein FtsL, partial [Candidatus Muproteobacteria bacterium RBG_16_64_10]